MYRGNSFFQCDTLYSHSHSVDVTSENSSLLNSASEWNVRESMEAKMAAAVSSKMTVAGYLTEAHFLSLTTLIMGLFTLDGGIQIHSQGLHSRSMHFLS